MYAVKFNLVTSVPLSLCPRAIAEHYIWLPTVTIIILWRIVYISTTTSIKPLHSQLWWWICPSKLYNTLVQSVLVTIQECSWSSIDAVQNLKNIRTKQISYLQTYYTFRSLFQSLHLVHEMYLVNTLPCYAVHNMCMHWPLQLPLYLPLSKNLGEIRWKRCM